MFHFHPQEPGEGHTSVDMAATYAGEIFANGYSQEFSIYDPLLLIEAKRLPTSGARQQEYVTGGAVSSGAIQRFKRGDHGRNSDRACIVAYVQEGDLAEWHAVINRWIEELITGPKDDCNWSHADLLEATEMLAEQGVSRHRSLHERPAKRCGGPIELDHLWVRMNVA